MVAHNDQRLRMFELWTSVSDLVNRAKRDPREVSEVLQVIKDKTDFAQRFFPELLQPESLLKDWQKFFKEVWGIKQNLSKLSLPARQEGFNWPVVMLEGMTARRIVNKMRERMKVWVWDEGQLDKVESDREPNHDYAIWLRDRVEADEELKNLSRNDLKAHGVNCVTLPERLMLESFHYWKTNQHMDISNWTLCAGSRDPGGYVPCVRWDSRYGEVHVGLCYPYERYDTLRCRAAIS